jgi:predicted transcriptional regulator
MNTAKLIRDLIETGMTQAMIGHHIGCSQGAISQHLKADGKSTISHDRGVKLAALHKRLCGGAAKSRASDASPSEGARA